MAVEELLLHDRAAALNSPFARGSLVTKISFLQSKGGGACLESPLGRCLARTSRGLLQEPLEARNTPPTSSALEIEHTSTSRALCILLPA